MGRVRASRRGTTDSGGYSGSGLADLDKATKHMAKQATKKKITDAADKVSGFIEMARFFDNQLERVTGYNTKQLVTKGWNWLKSKFKKNKQQQQTDTEKMLFPQADTKGQEEAYNNTMEGITGQHGIHGNSLIKPNQAMTISFFG